MPRNRRRTKAVTLSSAPAGITAVAYATGLSVDRAARTISGDITVYNEPSSSQKIVLHDGSLIPRMPLTRVKLTRDHNHADPLGYMLSWDRSRRATFWVAPGENGDRALQEAEDKLRDGFSVGFTIQQYAFDEDFNLHVYSADFYEVTLCAIPDFADAQVTNVAAALAAARKETIMNRAQLAAALAAGTITQELHDAEVAKLDAADSAALQAAALATAPLATPVAPAPDSQAPGATPVAPVPAELAAGPSTVPAAPGVTVIERGLSLDQVIRRVATAFNSGDRQQIALAISDIVPANDAGTAFINDPTWIGQLFQARDDTRRWIEAWGGTSQLLGLKTKGWRWTLRPKPAKYTGNKAEVPSGGATTEPVEFTAERWAGGWDIDRAFVDFGDEAFLRAFWEAAVSEYNIDSDADIATKTIAAATAGANVTTNALALITTLAKDVRAVKGARMTTMFLADDVFDAYAELKSADLPAWLANAVGGVDLSDGTAKITDKLTIEADSSMTSGWGVAFDKRGATVREKKPIQVKGVDVAHAGIDLGFYSYGAFEVHDARVIRKRRLVVA